MTDKVLLPFEATDAMADAVKNIVSAYAAKKVWEQMVMVALFDAGAAPVQPTEPVAGYLVVDVEKYAALQVKAALAEQAAPVASEEVEAMCERLWHGEEGAVEDGIALLRKLDAERATAQTSASPIPSTSPDCLP